MASCALAAAAMALVIASSATAQEPGMLPEFDPGVAESYPPTSDFGGGAFFSQELGSLLRVRYNTESYGQEENGNLDIGTMKVWNFDDAISFFDGQVTLNDEAGVGFNTGVGFRWMGWSPFQWEPMRINGFSLWADGTHTSSGAFFPQIGLSWESLGDMWDFRANSYIPLGARDQVGTFEPTGNLAFVGNNLVDETVADRFTSYNAGELEFARRLGRERDAWAFAGPYALARDGDDAAGYKVGLRGYAYPDLLVQLAVSDDDIFHTNASFSIVWFVGRTRTDFQPAYGLPDRMREPVLRNDYVALREDTVTSGVALTDTDGEAIRFVHLDSDAPGGGDGTFENPLNDVADSFGNSMEGDILLMYSDSVFSSQGALVMRDNQRLLGEGDDMTFQITTQQEGVIDIPETSPGASEGAKPIIMNSTGSEAITLADANEVANLAIDGSAGDGIAAGADGAGNPNLHDLMIMNTTGDGIVTSPFVREDEDDPNLMTVAGNVTIDNVIFDNIGGDDIAIDSATTADVTDPDVTLQETISITNVTSTNGNGRGIFLQNTHDGGTATVMNYSNEMGGLAGGSVLRFEGNMGDEFAGDLTLNNVDISGNVGYAFDFLDVADTSTVMILGNSSYDGGFNAAGGMRFDAVDGTVSVSSTTLEGGSMQGVFITGDSDGMFDFDETMSLNMIGGTAFDVNGFTGTLTMNGDIMNNNTGVALSIQNVSLDKASLTFNGDIQHGTELAPSASVGILVQNNMDEGTLLITGESTLVTTGANAVTLANNDGLDMNLNGLLDITTDSGTGFSATGGGMLTVLGDMNTIDVTNGIGLEITNMEITAGNVAFETVNASGGSNGIILEDNTGPGEVIIGDDGAADGAGGMLSNFNEEAIVVQNTSATFNGLDISGANIDNASATSVRVTHDNDEDMSVAFNNVDIDAQNAMTAGMTVTGTGATGDFTMDATNVDIASRDSTALLVTELDGTSTFNELTVHDSWSGVAIVDSDGSFTFNNATIIETVNAIDFEVSGGTATVSMAGDIDNTDGDGDQSINIHDITGGSVVMTGTVTDSNGGIVINNNSGGSVNLAGDYTINTTGAANAITITDNTGADVSIGDFEVTTEGGTGFVATGGGDLTVNGSDNTITTTTGTGLLITDANIVGQASFESVSVDGAANGIVLQDLTGGSVTVTGTGTTDGSGGTLDTTGNAIVLTNVASASLNNIQIEDDGGADTGGIAVTNDDANAMNVALTNVDISSATDDGVNVSATGSGSFDLAINDSDYSGVTNQAFDMTANTSANNVDVTIDGLTTDQDFVVNTGNSAAVDLRLSNSTINSNTDLNFNSSGDTDLLFDTVTFDAASGVTFSLDFASNTEDVDAIFRDNDVEAENATAFELTANGTNTDIDFLLNNNDFENNSGGSETVNIFANGGATLDSNITNNFFTNSGAADEFAMESDGASTRINLDLDNNTSSGVYELTTSFNGGGFNFGVVDRDNVNSQNTGMVNFNPAIGDFEDIAGPVQQPTLP